MPRRSVVTPRILETSLKPQKRRAVGEKPAENRYPIHELLRRRWSPRAFSERPVEAEKLRGLLEAARWAPSSFNEQPWSFILATKESPADYDRLLGCLTEGNRTWAGRAPVLMLSVAKTHFDHNGRPNRHALHDVGLAVENLVVEATHLGLFVHQMAGFRVDQARDLLGIPDGHEPVAMMVVGYAEDDPNSLPEELTKRELAPRKRRSQQEFVFSGAWGRVFTDREPK